ncbi:hypothetical protein KF707_01875 [Candidatus Obscuribacterales bacterium]|nr:hypothetical protein [Candidatus Obscuribacterales bacterium]MBX3150701.1 hypothetical protein [Candidatus Obscuribacterales bacterium]
MQVDTAYGIDRHHISQQQSFLSSKVFSAAKFSQLHLSYKSKVNWFPQADATDASLIL